MNTKDIMMRLSQSITTEAQARQVAEALGVDPTRVAWQPRLDLTLHSLAQRLEGKRDLELRLHLALSDVVDAQQAAVRSDRAVAARVQALLAAWPRNAKLPSLPELAAIVGGSPDQIEALLAAGTEETAPCPECDGDGAAEVDMCALCEQGIQRTCEACDGSGLAAGALERS